MPIHSQEVASGHRFEFGKNWSRFLLTVSEERIKTAENSLKEMLGLENMKGKNFLDAGSGSGLFSLAAKRLGASVYSFDYDPSSVSCTRELKRRFFPDDIDWTVEEGSVLDLDYLRSLGKFDIVYSWGVLHHTGALWQALNNISCLVAKEGRLCVAIYNDQGGKSQYWKEIKKLYNNNIIFRAGIILFHFPYLIGLRYMIRLLSGRAKMARGMSLWFDMKDWLGGYPFEVAKPEEIISYYLVRGFTIENLRTCGGRHGCNEFVFANNRESLK